MVRYIIVIFAALLAIVLISFLWPKFTTQPRPAPLEAVADVAENTVLGEQITKSLGVDKDTAVEPINIQKTATEITGKIISDMGEKATQVVANTVTTQIVKQIDQLPPTQQSQLKEIICKAQ